MARSFRVVLTWSVMVLLGLYPALADGPCDPVAEKVEVDDEDEKAEAQECDRDDLLEEFLKNWGEFIESCDLVREHIRPSHASHDDYAAAIGRARSLTEVLQDSQDTAEDVDRVLSDVDLVGRQLNDLNTTFKSEESAETDPSAGDDDDSENEEDLTALFCQARIEWKKCHVWRERFTACLDDLNASEQEHD